MKPTSRKLKASVIAIVFASITTCVLSLSGITPDNMKILIECYKWIMIAALGGFQAAQTLTDIKTKKEDNGHNEMAEK